MTKKSFIYVLPLVSCFLCPVLCWSDSRIAIKTVITESNPSPNIGNPSITRTIYYQHAGLRRKDSLGVGTTPEIESLANCQTKKGYLIDLTAHEYRNYNVVRFASDDQRAEYLKKVGRAAIPVESVTVETGERKVFFGYSARHLITTNKRGDTSEEEIIDGWYIDHESGDPDCAPDFVRNEPYFVVGTALVGFPDIAVVRHTGPLPTGLAVESKRTVKMIPTGEIQPRTTTVERTVEDLSDAPLVPALFELPAGSRENSQLLRGGTGGTTR